MRLRISHVFTLVAGAVGIALASSTRGDAVLDTSANTSYGAVWYTNQTGSYAQHVINFANALGPAPTLPIATSDSISGGGNSDASNYLLTNTGFSIGVSATRTGTMWSDSESWGYLYFTVTDGSTIAQLNGAYHYTSGEVFTAEIADVTTGKYLEEFDGTANSYSIPSGSLTLGTPGGAETTTTSGTLSLSAPLNPNDHYEFFYDVGVWANGGADSGASGSGTVGISFTDSADPSPLVAPAPPAALAGAGLLGLLGAMTLICHRRAVVVFR